MPTIVSVQILRAVAAIAVVIVHAGIELNYWGHTSITWHLRGASGVDLFFVISGFVMVYVSKQQFGQPSAPTTFLIRRVIRVVPLYWLVTTLSMLFSSHPLHRVISSYLFLPDPYGDEPLVLQAWTLRYEAFFYVLFAIGLHFSERVAVTAICGILVGTILSGVPYYGSSLVLEFALGALIGLAHNEGIRMPSPVAILCIVAGFFAIVIPDGLIVSSRLIGWGLPAAAIVAGATLNGPIAQWNAAPLLTEIGEASYSLYLIHPPIVRGVATAMRDGFRFNLAAHAASYMILAVALCIFISVLIHRYVEVPIIKTLKDHLIRRPSEHQAIVTG